MELKGITLLSIVTKLWKCELLQKVTGDYCGERSKENHCNSYERKI